MLKHQLDHTSRNHLKNLSVSHFGGRTLIYSLATLLCISTSVRARTNDSAHLPLRFDQQLQELIMQISPSVVTVQVAIDPGAASASYQEAVTSTAKLSNAHPIVVRNVSAIVVDSSGLMICAASALPENDSMFISRDGAQYEVRKLGIDYRSGLALLQTLAPGLLPVEMSEEVAPTGSLTLHLSASRPGLVDPLITFSAGPSRLDGYLEFSGPAGDGIVGGAFFNMSGELVGVSLGSIEVAGSGSRIYAAPASRIDPIVARLRCCGDRPAGYLGVQVVDTEIRGIPSTLKTQLGMFQTPPNATYAAVGTLEQSSVPGALVTVVEPLSPADRAGIRIGDIVISCDNLPITSADALRDFVRGCQPDSSVRIVALRGFDIGQHAVTIGAAPLKGDFNQTAESSIPPTFMTEFGVTDSLLRIIQRLEARVRALEAQAAGRR